MSLNSINWLARIAIIAVLSGASSVSSTLAAEKNDSSPTAARSAPTAEEIAGWIAQLDDNRYLVRERATQQLIDAGAAALDPLLAAAHGEQPEPADRAVWIMRRIARSRDNDQAIAALERLVQLRNRPLLVEKAATDLDQRSIAACQARLTPLGAEITIEPAQFDGISVVPLLQIRLGDEWRGTLEDLRCIAQLQRQQHFRLQGKPFDNEVAKLFEEKEKLAFVQFLDTKVTPTAVDGIKAHHPDAIVYVRGQALLGVQAENHPGGVKVSRVEPGTAAANAGIVAGDVIASMDGHTLPDFDRLTARIAQHEPGEAVEVEIVRGDERKKISVTLGSWAGQE
jgi:hypothetical protein